MAKRSKNTVDYFPHSVHSGKTMFIIENKYGNDGYSFWFKVLEMLGANENHYIDCRDGETWEFLLAKTKVTDEVAKEILETLSTLNAILPELWKHKIIWSENFINNILDAYKRRTSKCMHFETLCKHLGVKCKQKSRSVKSSGAEIPKEKESKEDKSKVNEIGDLQEYENLNNEDFKKSYQEWIDYKKEKRKALTQSTVIKQLEFLNKQPDPIACINKSIQSGWQGLFEVKDNNNGQSTGSPQSKSGGNPKTNGLPVNPIRGKNVKEY
jgi:hypothetical protein